jgi:DNA-binding CsgD family transcriptional regulator
VKGVQLFVDLGGLFGDNLSGRRRFFRVKDSPALYTSSFFCGTPHELALRVAHQLFREPGFRLHWRFNLLPNQRQLIDLIGCVYDAARNPAAWTRFLGDFARLGRGTMAALVWHDPKHEQYGVVSHNMPEEYKTLYGRYYGQHDEWFKGAVGIIRTGWVGTRQMVCSDETLLNRRFYCDYLRGFNVFHQCGAILNHTETANASIALLRPKRKGAFEDSTLALLRLLVPHLQRALQIQQQVGDLHVYSNALESAIDHLNAGVVFVDSRGGVVHCNRKAEELLRRNDGLRITHNRLTASVPRESSDLQALITGALQTGEGKGLNAGGTSLVSRKAGRALSMTVAPLRDVGAGFEQQPYAIAFISDPDQKVALPADLLRRCYGLTVAEARLATTLLEGRSLKDAADLSGVTHNTAKSQLKSIFLKTQVQRQSELVKLLLAGSCQILVPKP